MRMVARVFRAFTTAGPLLLPRGAGFDMITVTDARAPLAFLPVFCVAALSAAPPAAQPQAPAGPRIVAVGDIHGAGPGLTQILQAAGLIDAKQKWSGGNARLVQTGDILDRGADVREVMDLLMRLEGEARRAGGRVDVLFGNHEGMNVLHDFRDVSPEALARSRTHAPTSGSARRSTATRRSPNAPARRSIATSGWRRIRAGSLEYVEAFGPSGHVRPLDPGAQAGPADRRHASSCTPACIPSARSRSTKSTARSNRRCAAGTTWSPRSSGRGCAAPFFTLQEIINAAQVEIGKIAVAQKTGEPLADYVTPEFIRPLQFLMNFEKLALIESDGPLWYRGLATLPEDQQPAVDALLSRHGARRIVLGHTPQLPAGRIRTRFGGLVVLIDTGMLTSYFKGGQPSALEIQDGRLTAIYLSGREPLSGTAAVVSPAWAAANAH